MASSSQVGHGFAAASGALLIRELSISFAAEIVGIISRCLTCRRVGVMIPRLFGPEASGLHPFLRSLARQHAIECPVPDHSTTPRARHPGSRNRCTYRETQRFQKARQTHERSRAESGSAVCSRRREWPKPIVRSMAIPREYLRPRPEPRLALPGTTWLADA